MIICPWKDLARYESIIPGLKEAMEVLNEQQKKVIYYRYFEDLTQSKIAEMMGVSQMQVSRLEKSALEKIRGLMKVADD